MSNQLVKRDYLEGYRKVFPKTFTDAIKDRDSGMSLAEILQGFNMYFLSYNGNKALTRCSVPLSLRKEGLWITYVLYDHTVITEWYNSDNIDDEAFGSDDNWRQSSNMLVGDISISADGYWVIEGKKTSTKAQGETGVTPLLRFGDNNKLQVSYNEGKEWEDISSDITNNLKISKYIGINEALPTSGIAEGTIYMKGPYYDENDINNDNPIYRMWIYAWKGNTLAWQDNGEFTSIFAGVVQTTGNSETEVMSQAAITKELTELAEDLDKKADKTEIPTKLSQLEKDIDFGEAYYITSFSKNLLDEEIPDDGKIYFFPCQEQGLTEAIKNKKSIRLLSSGSYPEIGYLESVRAETDDMNYLTFFDGVHVIIVDFYLDGSQAEISRRLLITKDNINGNLESDIYYITSFDYQGILRGILNGDNRIQCYEPNLYQAVKDNKAIRLFFDMRYHDGYYEAFSAVVDDFIYLTFENETSKFILDIVNDGSDLTFSIYDDAKIREELSRLDTDKADKSEIPTKLSDLEQDIEIRYDDTEIVNKLKDLENTKVDEARVAQLISLEHVYFRYMESENKVYAKGYYLEEWAPLDANVFFAIIGRPTTVHMGVIGDISGFNVSTNDFEIVTSVNGTSLTWIYNEKKYTLTFAYGEQIITSEPYEAGSSYDDTEIRQELTELSGAIALRNVGAEDTDESVEEPEIPTAESDVFKAIYGETTYEEIKAAYDSGKVVHCDYESYCYTLVRIADIGAYFTCVYSSTAKNLVCYSSNSTWKVAGNVLEATINKTTTISESSTDTQYPSAKAVYDAVEAVKEKDYELLLDTTFEEDVESFNASAVAPRLLECKDFIVLLELQYDESRANRSGYILFKNGSSWPSARIESIVTASYLTHYALRIHLGQGVDKTASIESHTNAWGNPQYGTPKGNIMGINMSNAPWDRFDFQFGFFANEKIMIYGK